MFPAWRSVPLVMFAGGISDLDNSLPHGTLIINLRQPSQIYSGLELDESDVWSSVGGGGVSPNYMKPVVSSRKKPLAVAKRAEAVVGGTASSLPVNIPDWAKMKILKEDYKDKRRRDIDDDVDGEDL
ncbi:hypothetical protein RJ640_020387 [Escallonia rubra]|uniref:Uncharacterized protein n=1 Tax=Escallonia rubra TaxID=112253 RepID=A0AA88QQ92_9ASTE|nr:hypothetical protein RJ640_020387 [Escallonia rubra]